MIGEIRAHARGTVVKTDHRDWHPAVLAAVRRLPETCRFHGENFERLGLQPWGEPRCDSCKDPWHRREALRILTDDERLNGDG